jgi:hypothetical protein
MKPDRARELYSDYAEETLSPALRLALDQHFQADAEARAEYADFARVYALLEAAEAEEVEVPHGFRASILEKVSAEHARREVAAPSNTVFSLGGLFRAPGRRRATGGVLAALAACVLVGVVVAPRYMTGTGQGSFGPLSTPPPAIPTTLTGTTLAQDADGDHYNFNLHLPTSVPSALVSAYVLTNNSQITDPSQLGQATSALNPPLNLTNDEAVTIPVTLPNSATEGSTIAFLVQWTPAGSQATAKQVIFAPTDTGQPAPALPATMNYYDALQAVAADDNVTVIADATTAPTQTVAPPAGTSPAQAQADLQAIANTVNGTVKKLSDNTYQVALGN